VLGLANGFEIWPEDLQPTFCGAIANSSQQLLFLFTDLYLNLEPSLINPTSFGGKSACDSLKNEWFSTPTFQSRFVALKLPSLKLSTVAP